MDDVDPRLIVPTPPPVGFIRIDGGRGDGGLYWAMQRKPKRRHLWAMRLVFGWRWCDQPEVGGYDARGIS